MNPPLPRLNMAPPVTAPHIISRWLRRVSSGVRVGLGRRNPSMAVGLDDKVYGGAGNAQEQQKAAHVRGGGHDHR